MKKLLSQWGLNPGEKRAIFFICAASLVGWGYLQIQRANFAEIPPLTAADSAAIAALRNASTEKSRSESEGAQSSKITADRATIHSKSDDTKRLLNINTATQIDFESLPGIGPTLARRIIEQRTARDGFRSIEDLLGVQGIGPKKFEQIKAQISCE